MQKHTTNKYSEKNIVIEQLYKGTCYLHVELKTLACGGFEKEPAKSKRTKMTLLAKRTHIAIKQKWKATISLVTAKATLIEATTTTKRHKIVTHVSCVLMLDILGAGVS